VQGGERRGERRDGWKRRGGGGQRGEKAASLDAESTKQKTTESREQTTVEKRLTL
jgi:hypothetical protein